ncbi:hypothetical protein Gorai_019068 [Gossypium raimondii]|uniref:Uncharacterized protein n=1 Tax=Gossypium raimondii TaxID=29730 RepID=A0A7J8PM63_GOSRA|nr:hypothetical protein [Gossypium raimondii]
MQWSNKNELYIPMRSSTTSTQGYFGLGPKTPTVTHTKGQGKEKLVQEAWTITLLDNHFKKKGSSIISLIFHHSYSEFPRSLNVLCMVDCRVLVVDFVDGKPGYSLKETTATISAAGIAAESSMDDVPREDSCRPVG